jgi:hypothetical protein
MILDLTDSVTGLDPQTSQQIPSLAILLANQIKQLQTHDHSENALKLYDLSKKLFEVGKIEVSLADLNLIRTIVRSLALPIGITGQILTKIELTLALAK